MSYSSLADALYFGPFVLVVVLGLAAYFTTVGSWRIPSVFATVVAYFLAGILVGWVQGQLTYVEVTRAFRDGVISYREWDELSVRALEHSAVRVMVGTVAALVVAALARSYSRRRSVRP
jgi:hypothetical protein